MFKKVFSRGDEHVALNSRQEAVPSPRQQQQQEPQAETDLEDDEDFEDEQLPMPAQTAAHSRGPDPMVSNQVGMGIRAASDAAHMASSVLPSAASRSSLHAGEQHQQQQQQEQSVPPRAQQQILQQHKQATMQKQKQPLAVEELQHQLLLESKAREVRRFTSTAGSRAFLQPCALPAPCSCIMPLTLPIKSHLRACDLPC